MPDSIEFEELDLTTPEWTDHLKIYHWHWWRRCRVKILVVTDGGGSFGDTFSFGLGKVLDIVKTDLWPHVVFDITTAHRGQTAADITNFKFDAVDLAKYHQVWFFGVARNGPAITAAELRAIAEFMDGGGGVFATGDHENLGVDLCAEIPRVRSMRRWHYPAPGPNGEPVAPAQTGLGRHDTLTDDPSTALVESSQTDKVPQVIRPKMYFTGSPFRPWGKVAKYPHPVLCGPRGPITHLPDHMHEGLIDAPADLGGVFDFAGYQATEYPTVGGKQQRPEVIAKATNFVTDAEFGVLGAYDGHRAGVGRVVVDATWHHWFNINIDPYENASTPGHQTYDAAVVPKWEEIKSYFRNVAAWLSPPALHTCLRNGGWLFSLRHHEVLMTIQDVGRLPNPLVYYWQLGVFARDALGRLAGRCQTIEWLWKIPLFPDWKWLADPWDPFPPDPPGPGPFVDIDDLAAVSLGGAIHALAAQVGEGGDDLIGRLIEDSAAIDEIAVRGAQQALAVAADQYRASCEWFQPYEQQAE